MQQLHSGTKMNFAALAAIVAKFGPSVLTYGPSVIQMLHTITETIKAGRGEEQVPQTTWDAIDRLKVQRGEDIYARLGITPPLPNP